MKKFTKSLLKWAVSGGIILLLVNVVHLIRAFGIMSGMSSGGAGMYLVDVYKPLFYIFGESILGPEMYIFGAIMYFLLGVLLGILFYFLINLFRKIVT